ncbi:glycosyltransferase [Phaeobacter sp. PT47_59]|uniref:glycosyltransferase family 2 protein n=1 Tax=Phaeobacter sp. PT47_59 TaxID=3029979 RepID=UPI00238053F3|nr:glycosyltransferase [Phaeobacter sp. PT47_59]MDE4175254.1 glycosyltransferase [Phaeobacter sp. PT47_59]
MKFSFVVTAYNIEDYIGPCLDSLAPCLRPGDQLIVVDDGSGDGTCDEILNRLACLEGRGIELCPIFLGANTHGGVGIPANVALTEVRGEALFFVDGDDLMEAAGFLAARQTYEARPSDLLIANYRVYDAGCDRYMPPADQPLWTRGAAVRDPEARRHLALQMIGVPWRKIYRTDFLRAAGLRFPEGDFFYEDNPFHWQACLAAGDIRFLDRSVCAHRVGRVGQTMAAHGIELTAFFDHYETILSLLPDGGYRPDALRWLLENMAWHIERLDPGAHWIYALRAQETLSAVPEADWQALRHDPVALRAWGVARVLAAGDLAAVISGWQGQAVMRRLADLEGRLQHLSDEMHRQQQTLGTVNHWMDGQRALQEFRALKAMARSGLGGPKDAE